MQKFEKIKTIADKRIALAKRGKTVSNDFVAGDILHITEKVDGHNASFSCAGEAFSREHLINPTTNAPLVPFATLVDSLVPIMSKLKQELLDPTHTYQFYGEFMVRNRVIDYAEDIYEKWVMFDIFDTTTNEYLGVEKAILVTDKMKNLVDTITADKILTPEVLHDEYKFSTYENLEQFVYDMHDASQIGVDGVMEGAVVSNLSRNFQGKPLRSKVVNSKFKESQRQVTNHKNHTLEIRALLEHLTQARVSKIIMNLRDEGILQPLSNEYYTTQLEIAVRAIAKDISEETDLTLPFETMEAGENVYNKIEAIARLTMIDIRNKHA